jgi:hypothetical protein
LLLLSYWDWPDHVITDRPETDFSSCELSLMFKLKAILCRHYHAIDISNYSDGTIRSVCDLVNSISHPQGSSSKTIDIVNLRRNSNALLWVLLVYKSSVIILWAPKIVRFFFFFFIWRKYFLIQLRKLCARISVYHL